MTLEVVGGEDMVFDIEPLDKSNDTGHPASEEFVACQAFFFFFPAENSLLTLRKDCSHSIDSMISIFFHEWTFLFFIRIKHSQNTHGNYHSSPLS